MWLGPIFFGSLSGVNPKLEKSNHHLSASLWNPSTSFKPKISLRAFFALTAEAKKTEEASGREETHKPRLSAGRTDYHPFTR